MQVTVHLFARARELAGADTVRVELPDRATAEVLRQRLAADFPQMVELLPHSALAVNGEFAGPSCTLAPTAEIALLPPVSGG